MDLGKKALVLIPVLVAIAGCSSSSNNRGTVDRSLIGPGASIEDAAAAADALADRIDGVILEDGFTATGSLPAGSASYTGIIGGEAGGGDGPAISHLADLSLNVDFDNSTITGTAKNFVTTVEGFENPTGSASLTGTVEDFAGTAGVSFAGNGTLTSGSNVADYKLLSASGDFGGTDGSVIAGQQFTDFEWTSGFTGTSFSDGLFGAERD